MVPGGRGVGGIKGYNAGCLEEETVKGTHSALSSLGMVLVFVLAAMAANAPTLTFKFKTIDVRAQTTYIFAVNNADVMVGAYVDYNLITHGFMRKAGKVTTIDHPAGLLTVCNDINAKLAIVGYYANSSGVYEGFLYQDKLFKDIPGPPGSMSARAYGINDQGDIVGEYQDTAANFHGFLWNGTTYKTLDVPGAVASVARGINKKGTIAIDWWASDNFIQSSLYNGKKYVTINVPGATDTSVRHINSQGDVVYWWIDSVGIYHGALRHFGKYYKFDDPNSIATLGSGINDHRVIVGSYQRDSYSSDGFEATY